MFVADLWGALFGSLAISISVSFLAGIFFIYGHAFLTIFERKSTISDCYSIALGMFLLSFVGWYFYRTGVPLSDYIIISLLIGALLFLWQLFRSIRESGLKLKLSFMAFPILSFLLALQSQVGFGEAGYSIGTLGNNDIFDWSILASYLLGQPGYDNVMTTVGVSAQQHRIDSFGTFFIIGIFSRYFDMPPVHISTYLTIFNMAAIGYAIYEILTRNLKIKPGRSLLVSFIICSSSFSFYLAYNNFYGQLLATFFFLVGVLSILYVSDREWTGHKRDLALGALFMLPGVAGILIVYQSGFVVFVSFLFALTVLFLIRKYGAAREVGINRAELFYPVVPLFISVLVASLILPELFRHMIFRTIDVKSALNGWPLPLVSPEYLVSFPVLKPFHKGVGGPFEYVIFLLITGFLFWKMYKANFMSGVKEKENAIALILLFVLSVILYLLAYLLKGGIYQVWKFASFVVLPLGFVFYVALMSFFENRAKDKRGERRVVVFMILVALINISWMPAKYRLISINDEIRQLDLVRQSIEKGLVKNVALSAMSYRETMLAFNVLSPEYKVYPMVATYVQPVDDEVIRNLPDKESRGIVSAACVPDRKLYAYGDGYKVVGLDVLLSDGLRRQFGTKNSDKCGANVEYIKGFSVVEPWGVWTEGGHSVMSIGLPDNMNNKDIVIELEVQQFGKSQDLEILFYGKAIKKKISNRTLVPLNISSEHIKNGKVRLEFNISTPLSPSSINSSSADDRKLGVGFISYYMRVDRSS